MNDITATIRINGRDEPLTAPTLVMLLAQMDIAPDQRGIAIALNGTVVPRTKWGGTQLTAGDAVEIVRVLQGG
jgi:sulfur carrier protein